MKYAITAEIPFESISDEAKIEVCKRIKSKCKVNVVGALFGDTKGLFYSFSRKEEWLQINPQMYQFICKHKLAIEKLNYYEWAKYLEKINDDSVMDHLLTKIDKSSERENLSIYRRILFEEFSWGCALPTGLHSMISISLWLKRLRCISILEIGR